MKQAFVLLCILLISCESKERNGPSIGSEMFSFSVTSIDTIISLNRAPSLEVEITNKTVDSLLLVYALDGSHYEMRYPHIYYTINGNKVRRWLRCGNNSCLKEDDLTLVPPGEKFNPFKAFQDGMPFVSFSRRHSRLFDSVGVYDIQFHYSTQTPDIYSFRGSVCPKDIIAGRLKEKIMAVPRISLSSNILSIRVVDSTSTDM